MYLCKTIHTYMTQCLSLVKVRDVTCRKINVTGSYRDWTGIYYPSEQKSKLLPDSPVYKKPGYDKFIFNSNSYEGWRFGNREDLETGAYYYLSKSFFKHFYKHEIICKQILFSR